MRFTTVRQIGMVMFKVVVPELVRDRKPSARVVRARLASCVVLRVVHQREASLLAAVAKLAIESITEVAPAGAKAGILFLGNT
ncbi:MAG: hypothetical protein WD894_07150 [Pirellulales bacterium]